MILQLSLPVPLHLPLGGLLLGQVAGDAGPLALLPCHVLCQPLVGLLLVVAADVGGLHDLLLGGVLDQPQSGLLPAGHLLLLPGAGKSCIG